MQMYMVYNFAYVERGVSISRVALITRFMGPTWDSSGADRTQVGPMLAPWTLLSEYLQATAYRWGSKRVVVINDKSKLYTIYRAPLYVPNDEWLFPSKQIVWDNDKLTILSLTSKTSRSSMGASKTENSRTTTCALLKYDCAHKIAI